MLVSVWFRGNKMKAQCTTRLTLLPLKMKQLSKRLRNDRVPFKTEKAPRPASAHWAGWGIEVQISSALSMVSWLEKLGVRKNGLSDSDTDLDVRREVCRSVGERSPCRSTEKLILIKLRHGWEEMDPIHLNLEIPVRSRPNPPVPIRLGGCCGARPADGVPD